MTSQAHSTGRHIDTGHRPALSDAELLQETIRKSISTSPEAFLKTVHDVDGVSIDIWEKEIRSCTWAVIQRGIEVVGIAVSRWPDHQIETNIDPVTARFIESVWIAPELRGHRMGERLLRYLLEEECTRYPDVKQFLLWVFKGNDRAIQLYRRIGFVKKAEQDVRSSRAELRVEYLMTFDALAMTTTGAAENEAGRQQDLRKSGVAYRILGVTA